MAPETAEVSTMIKTLALAVAPEEYSARLAEAEAEKTTWAALLPIFYYNDCLFSGAKLDLHLFEPRYRIMMRRVVEANRRFAYVCCFEAFAAKVGDVALVAEVRECEFLADGRALLSAALVAGRHEVTETYVEEGTQGLHYCRMTPVKDQDMSPEDLAKATQVCEDRFDSEDRFDRQGRHDRPPAHATIPPLVRSC